VSERALGSHGPGVALAPSVAVVSSSVTDGVRTLVLSRTVSGKTPDHASLPTSPGTLKMIAAEGSTSAFSYHHARTGAQIELLLTQSAACMCTPEEHGYLTYMDTAAREYHVGCTDEPRSDMLRKGDGTGRWGVPNAACSYKTYHGGLQCCSNQYFLTDREQAAENTTTDVYYLKWRYYFQEYVPASASTRASHKHLHHWVFLIDDAVNDYEEDNAHYGVASVGKIEAHLLGRQIGLEDVPTTYSQITPLVITPHHHAPNSIREELWNVDTGDVLCNMTGVYGHPSYGNTSAIFNEADYIAIMPCIFGHQAGLQFPFTFGPTTRLRAVKYFNNTYRHLGQMAQWTGLMVYDTDPY